MRATSGKSLFTETLYVAQIIRYVIVYGIASEPGGPLGRALVLLGGHMVSKTSLFHFDQDYSGLPVLRSTSRQVPR